MVTGQGVVAALKQKFRATTQASLAEHFGVTLQAVQGWANRESFTATQVAALAAKAAAARSSTIRPVVEFFPTDRAPSVRKAAQEIFSEKPDGVSHPYRKGLKDELQSTKGLYLFFDSRGQAIYVGKARLQSLWKEMRFAFNRDRGLLQKIRRVDHPERKQEYQTTDEKARQILEVQVQLHELAAYFSAYEVPEAMIDDLEALLVRSFSNNLLNKKMERFAGQRSRKTRKKGSKQGNRRVRRAKR